ncbi:MAG: tRNA threonylcarbamoyladenosine dehydratase [Clostridia bacterium]|nr:tRNA threonylcarbamoyladenosine dehydratase [Clostridia bacterium]
MEIFQREEILIGKENVEILNNKKVLLFGCGGVGSFILEALVRAGVGTIDIVDKDVVDITNINRQLIATYDTIGKDKVEVAKVRALSINPNIIVTTYKIFFDENTTEIDFSKYDYIIDAIDIVKSKIEIIKRAKEANIPIISSMGTGNKLDPFKFEIKDISKTTVCPLAKVIRKELKNMKIAKVKVLFSTEEPRPPQKSEDGIIQGSISFIPSVAGLMIAGEVIKDMINL